MSFGIGKSESIVPMIVVDAIGGNHRASTIGAAPAMYEDRAARRIFQNRQDLAKLGFSRRSQARHRHVEVSHSRFRDHALFGLRVPIGFSKFDHCLHSEAGQIAKSFAGRLRSAIDLRIHLIEILDSRSVGGRGGNSPGHSDANECTKPLQHGFLRMFPCDVDG